MDKVQYNETSMFMFYVPEIEVFRVFKVTIRRD